MPQFIRWYFHTKRQANKTSDTATPPYLSTELLEWGCHSKEKLTFVPTTGARAQDQRFSWDGVRRREVDH